MYLLVSFYLDLKLLDKYDLLLLALDKQYLIFGCGKVKMFIIVFSSSFCLSCLLKAVRFIEHVGRTQRLLKNVYNVVQFYLDTA